ncbi:MAG: hypothetical protein FWH27_01315 [Planctomycetaceae bacterium]|nr:hypothetical protein [Planctomycetaceae bacterium]
MSSKKKNVLQEQKTVLQERKTPGKSKKTPPSKPVKTQSGEQVQSSSATSATTDHQRNNRPPAQHRSLTFPAAVSLCSHPVPRILHFRL